MSFIAGTLTVLYDRNEENGAISKVSYGIDMYPDGDTDEPLRYHITNGDLITVFNSVTKGDIYWQGTIDMERMSGSVHGIQKDMGKRNWSRMFFQGLPAQIERDGKIMTGGLDPFCETGTEGIIWSIHEYGKQGYEGLVPLRKGDVLTVFNNVTDGNIAWHDKIIFDDKPVLWGGQNGLKYPPAPKSIQSPELWCHYALFKYPAIVMSAS